jgi:hypothetical protein
MRGNIERGVEEFLERKIGVKVIVRKEFKQKLGSEEEHYAK